MSRLVARQLLVLLLALLPSTSQGEATFSSPPLSHMHKSLARLFPPQRPHQAS